MLFAAEWEVHYNSDRTGVRLIGPKPRWARADGGEAGLHPSNIHDNAYAVGAIDFTGDMPIILGPDGPSRSAASSARRPSRKPSCGRSASCARATRSASRRLSPAEARNAPGEAKCGDRRARARSLPPISRARLGADDCLVGASAAAGERPSVVYRRAATTISSSNTVRWCSISRCACACMR